MDPLSIGAGVGSLSSACIVSLKNLNELLGKFRDAPKTLRDLSSETKVISISLSQLQNVLVSDEHSILNRSLLKPDIRNALDVALTGCRVTLSCLETEIHSLTANIGADQKLSLSDRAKIAWKEDKFKLLLQQLSRQHHAIANLQQSFQMRAIGDILKRIVSARNQSMIQQVTEDTKSLRGMYPQSNAAKSFLDSLESTGVNETNFSVISEQHFEFDDLVTNSQAYRRVLVAATHALKKNIGGNAVSTGDVNELASEGAQLGKGSNSTEEANQSRKMTAAPVSARGLKHSPIANPRENPGLQDNQSQQSTINHPQSFAQQIRGYLDHVEGESRNAAKENAHLRERLEESETATKAVVSQLLIVTKRAEVAETELETASKNNEEVVRDLRSLIDDWADRAEKAEKRLEVAEREVAQSKALNETIEAQYRYIIERLESELRDQSRDADAMRMDLQAQKRETAIAKNELKVAEREVAQNKAINKAVEAQYGYIVERLESELRGQFKIADTMRLDLEASKEETATVKKELEKLQAVQRELSVLFQKGNDLLQSQKETGDWP